MSPLVVPRPADRIILGLFTFGPDVEAGARLTDLGEFNKALDLFQSRGYSEVDTARSYTGGKQESWTRAANWKERGLILATKVEYPTNPGDNSADRVIESVDTSLRELGTDCVDVSITPSGVPRCIQNITSPWRRLIRSQIMYLHTAVS